MATIAAWDGSGLSDGASVDTSTAGTGDTPFDAVTAGTFTVDDTGLHAPRIQVDQQAATDAQLTWSSSTIGATLDSFAVRLYVELSAYPGSGAWRLVDARDDLNALLWWVDVHNSGVIRLKDAGGITVDQTAAAVGTGTELRVECVAQPDGGGGAQVDVYVYTGDSTTAADTLTATGLGLGLEQLRFGEPGTSPILATAWFDAMALSDQAVEIGPVPPPPAPLQRFPLDDRYELDLDGWTDITPWVYERNPVDISRGRSAEADTADPCQMSLTLDNRDGRFSARNPVGPWFGVLGRNVPIRASLPFGETYLSPGPGDADVASTPDVAALDITGDLDVRIEYTATNLGELIDVCGKRVDAGDQRSWNLGILASRRPALFWNTTGAAAGEFWAFATDLLPASDDRIALRATLDVDNGAGGYTVTFYTADSIDGPWTQLGDDLIGAAPTSVFAGTAPLEVGCCADGGGAPVRGKVHVFELRDGIGGAVVADPDFTVQTAGATSFVDAAGLTWTMQGSAELDDRLYRFHGEVPSWPVTWSKDGVDDYARITASGISRRLSQNAPTLRSTMFRGVSALDSLVAYWPLEDGQGATQAASGMAGAPPMRITGSPDMAGYSNWTASSPLPIVSGGRFIGQVPPYTPSGELLVRLFLFVDEPVGGETSLLKVGTTGTARWELTLWPDGDLSTYVYDSDGVQLVNSRINFFLNSAGFVLVDVELKQFGADVGWTTRVLDFVNTDTIHSSFNTISDVGSVSGQTLGAGREVIIGDGGGLGSVVVGHPFAVSRIHDVFDDDTMPTTVDYIFYAVVARNGENPSARITRLCAEENIAFAHYFEGKTGNDVTMGDQLDRSLLDLLRECETSDLGILFEPRDFLGFAYRSRLSLYNQDPVITLDWDSGQVAGDLVPVDDDQNIQNDVTAQRVGGSSVRVEQTTGPMSVLPPRQGGVGRYDTKVDLSLEGDVQLADQAAWRLHLGTTDEARYPTLHVDLRAPGLSDAMVETILGLNVGDRIDLTGLPTPDDVGLLVVGYSETLRLYEHRIVFNCVPASPWEIGVVGQDGHDRIDTGGAELIDAVTSTDTSLVVASTLGPEWTTDAADLPMDIMVAGERCTVTAVADGVADPFDRTVANGWGSDPDGRPWTVYGPAANFSVSGGEASMSIPAAGNAYVTGLALGTPAVDVEVRFGAPADPITGAPVYVYVLAYVDQSTFAWYALRIGLHLDDTVRVQLERRDSGGTVTVLAPEVTVPGVVVHTATTYHARLRVQDGVVAGRIWRAAIAEPTNWHVIARDDTYTAGDVGLQVFVPAANSNVMPLVFPFREVRTHNPQTFTVTRSVNGVTKPQSAGADVRLAEPVYIAL